MPPIGGEILDFICPYISSFWTAPPDSWARSVQSNDLIEGLSPHFSQPLIFSDFYVGRVGGTLTIFASCAVSALPDFNIVNNLL